MAQQTIIAKMNNATATISPIFNPKKGMTSRPTGGRVHSQRTRANAISSK